jgi:hypothetical protein
MLRMPLPARTELPTLARQPATFAKRYWIPLVILLIGATVDTITTYHNAVLYGADVEVHPVQRWLFVWLGSEAGVPIAKLIQISFVLFVAAWWKPWCGWIIGGCGLLYSLAAVSNHFLLL